MKHNDTTLNEQIILSYYGELSEQEQSDLNAALQGSKDLRRNDSLFRESLEHIKQSPVEDVDNRVFDRLERSILNATVRAEPLTSNHVAPSQHRSFWTSLRELFLSPQRIGFTLAGGLAFMLIGMFVGSQLQIGPKTTEQNTNVAGISASDSPPLIAASQQVTDFLKRSQIYLATSVDHEVTCEKCLPIQAQMPNREIARKLLTEASALKMKSQGNPEIQKLITDIEFVLDNIGNNADINPAQAEVVHHIASNAVCEVSARIDSANAHRQSQIQQANQQANHPSNPK